MNNTCPTCGQIHDTWPALAFKAPDAYTQLTAEEKQTIASLSQDFCVIEYQDQTDRFIRVTLTQKVNDHCENLEYGVWVSLSEASFQDYQDNFDDKNHEAVYFGWLSNDLPGYTFDDFIPTKVQTQGGNLRPEIFPKPDLEHPFVQDYYQGISKAEAERRIQAMLG